MLDVKNRGQDPKGLDRQIMISAMWQASRHHEIKLSTIAAAVRGSASGLRGSDKQAAFKMDRHAVRRRLESLNQRYPWFKDLLECLQSGTTSANFEQVRVLYAFFRHRTLEKAANELGKTPQAVSDMLRRLADSNPGVERLIQETRLEENPSRAPRPKPTGEKAWPRSKQGKAGRVVQLSYDPPVGRAD